MEVELMKSEANFSFHLDGNNSIDANLLSRLIQDMAKLTEIASKEKNPDVYLKMNVTAFKNGSFQIDFSTICEITQKWFPVAATVASFALSVVNTVKGYFEIKKFLKGKKPKSVVEEEDKVQIESDDGNKICVTKAEAAVINNVTIDQLTVNISNSVIEHNPDGGFTFQANGDSLYCTSEDVKAISYPLPIKTAINCQRFRYEAFLLIKSLDLLGRSQWSFRYNDHTIYANILDDEFVEKIHRGVSVKAGDCIKATLEVYVDLDPMGNPMAGSEKYTILKVHGNIIHNDDYIQTSLF